MSENKLFVIVIVIVIVIASSIHQPTETANYIHQSTGIQQAVSINLQK